MATEIHPTAVIAPGAELDEGCKVGPYCVIGDGVRLGAGTELQSHVVVEGDTTLGPGCSVYSFACLGKQTQDLKFSGGPTRVTIGANTTIREYVTVHQPTASGGLTAVGDGCSLLAYCHIAHDCLVGNGVIMSNGNNLAGHVVVDDHVVFGGLGGVHQFVRIGTMAMIGATGKVVQDIPPFCLADGNPAGVVTINKVGMQRNGKDNETIRAVTQTFKTLFRSGLRLEEAMQKARAEAGTVPEVVEMLDFVAASERGVARPRQRD